MIRISDLNKSFGDRVLFEIEKLTLSDSDKVFLIGKNGVGKSTLLKVIGGIDKEFSGVVKADNSVFYVDKFSKTTKNDHAYSLANLNKWNKMSPGEMTKANIIDAVLSSGFLLIDEPTANLDSHGIDIIIDLLKKRKEGFLIVSHDRRFINELSDKIIELDDGKINEYYGNYEHYLKVKKELLNRQNKEYEEYKSEIARLEQSIGHIKKERSKIKTTPRRMGNSEARLHKMGGQSNKKNMDNRIKSIESRIKNMEVKEKPKETGVMSITIPEQERIKSDRIIWSDKLNKRFNNKMIFDNANFLLNPTDKIALIGKNGTGKSTLLKMIIDGESINKHKRLKLGYYSQGNESLDLKKSIIENISESSIYDETFNRIVLANLLFGAEDINKRVEVLSDGEKSRVKIAKLLLGDYNYLVLDEITNFLDLESLEIVEELLKNYDRGFIFVSHDRWFTDSVSDRKLEIKGNKIIDLSKKVEKTKESDSLLREFRISEVLAKLSSETSEERRKELEKEYENLTQVHFEKRS